MKATYGNRNWISEDLRNVVIAIESHITAGAPDVLHQVKEVVDL